MAVAADRLQLMTTFVRIVETGSISAAARDLRLAQSSASRQLAQLEERLGATLLHRTTHALTLTAAGRRLLADCRAMLNDWRAIEERVREDAANPRGTLRVVASVALGQLVLPRLTGRYCRQYPDVDVDWSVDDGPVSMLDSGIDCLIKVGRIREQSVVARIVGEVRGVLVAAPRVVEERGSPQAPADLRGWPMISVQPYFDDRIPVQDGQGRATKVRGRPSLHTRSVVAAKGAAEGGAGFTLLPEWLARPAIDAGDLRQVLVGWEGTPQPLSIGTLPTRQKPLHVALFVEDVVRGLHDLPGLVRRGTRR